MTEIRYAPHFRFLSIFGVLTFGGIAFIGWMAYRVEGFQFGLVIMVPILVVGLYWLIALALAPQSVRFEAVHLTIRRWIGTKIIPYDEVLSVSQSYPFISIKTQIGTVRLHKLFANDDAKLINALEKYVPALIQARTQRLAGNFPIILKGKLVATLFTALNGIILLVFGIGTFWYAATGLSESDTDQQIFLFLMGLASAGLGILFIYMLLWTYPYRTTFTPNQMTQQFLLRATVQPMNGVVNFQSGYEVRTIRGRQRQVYHIAFIYANGNTFKWIPEEFYFPIDYVDAAAANLVTDLTEQLHRAYLHLPAIQTRSL